MLMFSADSARLMVGASYMWDEGAEGAQTADWLLLFICELGEEVKVHHYNH